MKKPLLTVLILMGFMSLFAQKKFDLIVTTKNDSLACHIDSITEKYIYIQMRHKGMWVSTMYNKEYIHEYKENVIDKKSFFFKDGSSYIYTKPKPKGYQHAHRLLFSPTSFGLGQRNRYFTTLGGVIYSIQYGISDKFYFDYGTSFLAFPMYGNLNFSHAINDKFAFSLGNLFVFAIWLEPGLWGNLTYGLISYGTKENHINVGPGFLFFPGSFLQKTNSPAFTLSGHFKLGERTYLLTEHYYTTVNDHYDNDYDLPGSTPEAPIKQPYEYNFKRNLVFGITGIRLIGKRNPNIAWQFGFVDFILIMENDVPPEYQNYENHLDAGKVLFTPFPFISFSYKF